MRIIPLVSLSLFIGLAQPALAQTAPKNAAPPEEKAIVITGIADGARVVEVNYDKVWKGCAECKRALAKLDRLAAGFRDERDVAYAMGSGGPAGAPSPDTSASYVGSWQRSSADSVEKFAEGPRAFQTTSGGLALARRQDTARRTKQEMLSRYAAPEMATLKGYMRSFLNQLAPHLGEATEAERVARGASFGLVDTKRTKLSARSLKRIDVTQAVIRRLDQMDFTIVLPDPPARGPARK